MGVHTQNIVRCLDRRQPWADKANDVNPIVEGIRCASDGKHVANRQPAWNTPAVTIVTLFPLPVGTIPLGLAKGTTVG